MDDDRHGWRRKRLRGQPPAPRQELQSDIALTNSIIGADRLARIEADAAQMAPSPDPEDLLTTWADGWYRSGDTWWLYRIGLYVAEDLRLLGKVRGKPESGQQ